VITNNTFTSAATVLLSLNAAPGTVVTQNNLLGEASSTAIDILNCGKLGNNPTLIANNTILLLGPSSSGDAIAAHQDGSGTTIVKILNNNISTNKQGTGLHVFQFLITNISLLVQGNDFHNNKIGVLLIGDNTTTADVDMGGGDLGSLGGNDFRGYSRPVSQTSAAIVQTQAPFRVTKATQNIFPSGIEPFSFVFVNGQGTVVVDPPLSDPRAFVQTLYNQLLGRSGAALRTRLLGQRPQHPGPGCCRQQHPEGPARRSAASSMPSTSASSAGKQTPPAATAGSTSCNTAGPRSSWRTCS